MGNAPGLATSIAIFASLILPAHAAADNFVKEDGSYRTIEESLAAEQILQVRALFDAWNTGAAAFPSKQEQEPFVLAFREPLSCPGEEPRYEMRDVSFDAWERLPEFLTPELPLDTGAQLFLLGLVEGNLPAMAELNPSQFTDQLLRGAYLLLGTAQLASKDAGASQIRTGFVWSAMQAFPFMIDPFNPAICPLDRASPPAPE